MLQYADYAGLLTSLPTVEEVLDDHAPELGHDLIAYRNHVYRVVNLCLAIAGDSRVELEKDSCRCGLPRPRGWGGAIRSTTSPPQSRWRASPSRLEGGQSGSPRSRR